jgi:type II secretory ATPase GspE/PulE/Tfp pilus assembly ATPase PilB-like protein
VATADENLDAAVAILALEHNLLTPRDAAKILLAARATGRPIAELLRESVSEVDLLSAVAVELGLEFYDLNAIAQPFVVDDDAVRRFERSRLSTHSIIPLKDRDGAPVVAMANPFDPDANTLAESRYSGEFQRVLAPRQQIQARLLQVSDDFTATGANAVPEYVTHLLTRAAVDRAADIVLRANDQGRLDVRFSVDGALRPVAYPESLIGREAEVIGTVMHRASPMDPANLRVPQDGQMTFTVAGSPVDARVAYIQTVAGANMTIRLLDPTVLATRRLDDAGFSPEHLHVLRKAVAAAQGTVLVAGPTGSGKTTTQYSLLREIDVVTRNVLTIEDPVEYRLAGIGQVQVRADQGMSFAQVLRNLLRQRPDVILLGEIRDGEAAQAALDASNTGHVVLTTVHASSAPTAFMRLVELGAKPFVVADAVSVVMSQRLVRRVHECATTAPPSRAERELLDSWGATDIDRVARPAGCPICQGTGFFERVAVAELLVPDTAVREAITAGASKQTLLAAAHAAGWRPLLVDAVRHIRAGRTTVAEVARLLTVGADDIFWSTH